MNFLDIDINFSRQWTLLFSTIDIKIEYMCERYISKNCKKKYKKNAHANRISFSKKKKK